MLTAEIIKENDALSGLTDAQITAITELSKNDENTVIGAKIGALHGQYDADVLAVTGVAKKSGEKSYDYVKRVLGEFKSSSDKAGELETELAKANQANKDLQAKLEKGAGDEELRKQVRDLTSRTTQLQEQLKAKQTEYDTLKAGQDKAIMDMRVDYAFKDAVSGIKFKAGITEPIQKLLIQSAKQEVLSKDTPDFVEDASGEKKLVFRDANGLILNNPKNNLNPYTVKELLMETALKDAVETKVVRTGGGTGRVTVTGTNTGLIDLTTAKNQVEADDLIIKHLLALGLTRDSMQFSEQFSKLRKDNEVDKLPIR